MKHLLIPFAMLISLATPVLAQPGSLDITFDNDGIVTTDVGTEDDQARAVAIQPDGKVIIAGYADQGAGYELLLIRYNIDGSLDTTFNNTGIVTTNTGTVGFNSISAMVVQPDGKIVVGGNFLTGVNYNFGLVRYLPDGSLDTSFDLDGKKTISFGANHEFLNAIALQTDGKIVTAGYISTGPGFDFAVSRHNSDGSLDNSFSTDGKVTTVVGAGGIAQAASVAIQSDGKIVVAGHGLEGTRNEFAIVRYNTNGTPDNTFGTSGIVTEPIGTDFAEAKALAIQSDGKILLTGHSYNGFNFDYAVVRFLANGNIDPSFGVSGVGTLEIEGPIDFATCIALQPDGKILTAGYTGDQATHYNFALVRWNTNGSPDATFGNNGTVSTPAGASFDYARALAIDAEGKRAVVAGASYQGSHFVTAVAKYVIAEEDTVTGINIPKQANGQLSVYPNPASSAQVLRYSIEKGDYISIRITNISGQIVNTIAENEWRNAGIYQEPLNNLPAGVYLVIFSGATSGTQVIKVMKQ